MLQTMTKQDYVIICGDFGGVWDGSKREKYWLDWLEDKPFTTLFVSGNHENYNLLSEYATEYWHGGKVQFIRPTIVHLMRGQVFDLCGKRFFTMGGASSHDITDGILVPNDVEYHEAEDNLESCGRTVDYILSHCCPSSIMDVISGGMYQHDRLTDYFETLKKLNRMHIMAIYRYTVERSPSVARILGSASWVLILTKTKIKCLTVRKRRRRFA